MNFRRIEAMVGYTCLSKMIIIIGIAMKRFRPEDDQENLNDDVNYENLPYIIYKIA